MGKFSSQLRCFQKFSPSPECYKNHLELLLVPESQPRDVGHATPGAVLMNNKHRRSPECLKEEFDTEKKISLLAYGA